MDRYTHTHTVPETLQRTTIANALRKLWRNTEFVIQIEHQCSNTSTLDSTGILCPLLVTVGNLCDGIQESQGNAIFNQTNYNPTEVSLVKVRGTEFPSLVLFFFLHSLLLL